MDCCITHGIGTNILPWTLTAWFGIKNLEACVSGVASSSILLAAFFLSWGRHKCCNRLSTRPSYGSLPKPRHSRRFENTTDSMINAEFRNGEKDRACGINLSSVFRHSEETTFILQDILSSTVDVCVTAEPHLWEDKQGSAFCRVLAFFCFIYTRETHGKRPGLCVCMCGYLRVGVCVCL